MVAGAALRTSSKLSVLVIDDDPDILEYLQDFLAAEGFDVSTLADPSLAVDRIRDEVFHLVVLDLMMPKVSGLDLLAQIRGVDDDIAVIILTGYPTLDTATASMKHEVSAYIHKPFTPQEFREVIARIAKKKGLVLRREDELHAAIGRQIRDLRKGRGLTLRQLSRRTNLSVSLLSQIERAESSASVSSLFKVATALDVPLTDLFAGY
ncbi:MAG: response regulator [Deltaproteobacteria bacterium]